MPVQDPLAWISAIGSLGTAAIAVALAIELRNRERRQALVDLHVSLTTGETARARHVVTSVLLAAQHQNKAERLFAIESSFGLIWAMQRARNVFRLHRFDWTPVAEVDAPRRARTREVEAMLSWNLREIALAAVEFHTRFGVSWKIRDDDAWTELSGYLATRMPHSDRAKRAPRLESREARRRI